VLEYCEGPDLSYYLKKFKVIQEKEARLLLRQVMNAIKYLHTLPEKVIHYDLKPQNIMFHNGQIKITDFGLCKIMNDEVTRMELTSQGVGTYWYLPPECFFTDEKAVISTKVDIWSIGVIYYEMLFGQKPFGDKMSQMRILKEGIILKSAQVQFPGKPSSVSQESKDFIKLCLNYKQEERPDISELLNHPLFDRK
jgi:tousled-like kinase